jgi:hypothetical protein
MTFRTALRHIAVGLVRRPIRLVWLLFVGAIVVTLDDLAPSTIVGEILRGLVQLGGVALTAPVLTAALSGSGTASDSET